MPIYIGLDIGGTKFMAAAADENGQILRRCRNDTPAGRSEGLDLLDTMIAEVAAGETIHAIGAAIGGPLDWRTGVVSPLHQPAWRNVPLKARMEQYWGCPFYVDVDTNVAALAEYTLGGETADRFLYITLSTGMGGGFLVDGQVYRGMHGEHPEIGHQSIPYRCTHPERIQCECGVPDCLEGIVSGNAIRRIYGRPAEELDDAAWAEVAYNLGQGLRNLAAIYLPAVIVLGGGVAMGGGEKFITRARQVMAEHLRIVPMPEVRLSRLGLETALRGAIVLAMRGPHLLTSTPTPCHADS
jgi:predicted NBD/HSP70 family sugar kinase